MSELEQMKAPSRSERLMNRDFFLLWQGQLVSQLGTQAFMIAMMYWLMEATGSASLMGTVMMFSILPGIVLGPFAGTIADRYSRRTILVVCDLLSGCAMLVVAYLFFSHLDSIDLLIAGLFSVGLFNGLTQAFFRPAMMAAIPDLVPESKVASANGLTQFSFQFSGILGQGMGGIAYAALGAPLLFLADGLSFIFSSASEAFIRLPSQHPGEGRDRHPAGIVREMADGFRFVWGWQGMRSFLIMAGFINFFAQPFIILLPFYVSQVLGRGAQWYGFLFAGLSAGTVLGYIAAPRVQRAKQRQGQILLFSLLAIAVLFGSLSLVTIPMLALAIMLAAGTLMGIFNIILMTAFQLASPGEIRGRVMGLVTTIAMAASPLGMLLGGILGDLSGKNIPLIYILSAAGVVTATLVLGTRETVLEFLTNPSARPRDGGK